MLAQLLLTTLALGAPDYTKKVMVDPNYKPSRTPQQIAETLARSRRVRRVARRAATTTSTVVYRTEVRRPSWIWPALSLGLWYGTYWAFHDHSYYYGHRGYRGYRGGYRGHGGGRYYRHR